MRRQSSCGLTALRIDRVSILFGVWGSPDDALADANGIARTTGRFGWWVSARRTGNAFSFYVLSTGFRPGSRSTPRACSRFGAPKFSPSPFLFDNVNCLAKRVGMTPAGEKFPKTSNHESICNSCRHSQSDIQNHQTAPP